jgi:hypothetical protein
MPRCAIAVFHAFRPALTFMTKLPNRRIAVAGRFAFRFAVILFAHQKTAAIVPISAFRLALLIPAYQIAFAIVAVFAFRNAFVIPAHERAPAIIIILARRHAMRVFAHQTTGTIRIPFALNLNRRTLTGVGQFVTRLPRKTGTVTR